MRRRATGIKKIRNGRSAPRVLLLPTNRAAWRNKDDARLHPLMLRSLRSKRLEAWANALPLHTLRDAPSALLRVRAVNKGQTHMYKTDICDTSDCGPVLAEAIEGLTWQ